MISHTPRLIRTARLLAAAILVLASASAQTAESEKPPRLDALPSLTISTYLGTWYQVALFPNRFQRQCVSDTTASYQQAANGSLIVSNRCRVASGQWDEASGEARPVGTVDADQLRPAQLRVSFLPAWLRWLPVGWGNYWVIQLADDGRYAVISEASRRYLWVLARAPRLSAADETTIRGQLIKQGFDLGAWQGHEHAGQP